MDLKGQLQKTLQDQPLLVMTKCVAREIENLHRDMPDVFRETYLRAKATVKMPCAHTGGILSVDDCIEQFIGKKNEEKVFVATNDEELRNRLRNKGVAPLFFFEKKSGILVMDKPSEIQQTKFAMKE